MAVRDLDRLRELDVLPTASDTLQASFLALAVAMDDAAERYRLIAAGSACSRFRARPLSRPRQSA